MSIMVMQTTASSPFIKLTLAFIISVAISGYTSASSEKTAYIFFFCTVHMNRNL
jgi:hypothetical protein